MKEILLICILSSCSRLEFVQNGRQVFNISSNTNSEKIVEVEQTYDSYFWGLIPEKGIVNLDKAFFGQGIHAPSMVQYKRSHSLTDIIITTLTLGLYSPSTYKLSVYSAKENK